MECKIHSLKSINADTAVMLIWFFTSIPVGLRVIGSVDVYGREEVLLILGFILVLVVIFFAVVGRGAYQTYHHKLRNSLAALDNIRTFEKEREN